MGSVAPYTFTWDASHWDNVDAEWSSPGTYPITVGAVTARTAMAAVGSVTIPVTLAVTATTSMEMDSTVGVFVDSDDSGVFVSATTDRLYMRLPAFYRDDDATIPGISGRPLLRFLAAMVDQAGELESLLDQFTPPAASALTDPALADPAWLPWLAQLVGRRLHTPVADVAKARRSIADALTGTQPGTKASIVAAAQAVLTGTQTVLVTDHYGGDPWKIGVETIATETPPLIVGENALIWDSTAWDVAAWTEPDPIVLLLEESNVKPAGYQIVHYTSSALIWDTTEWDVAVWAA